MTTAVHILTTGGNKMLQVEVRQKSADEGTPDSVVFGQTIGPKAVSDVIYVHDGNYIVVEEVGEFIS
jgi:hypothetical protein